MLRTGLDGSADDEGHGIAVDGSGEAETSICLGDNFNYSYDGAGNLLAFSRWDEAGSQVETVNFVYNGANQIACLDGGGNGVCGDPDDVVYSYDAYGNLTSVGIRNYAYDAENRLVSVSDGASTTNYSYNGWTNAVRTGSGISNRG